MRLLRSKSTRCFKSPQVWSRTKFWKCSSTRSKWWIPNRPLFAKLNSFTLSARTLTTNQMHAKQHSTFSGNSLWWRDLTPSHSWNPQGNYCLTCCGLKIETSSKLTFWRLWTSLTKKRERQFKRPSWCLNYWILIRFQNIFTKIHMEAPATFPNLSKIFASIST